MAFAPSVHEHPVYRTPECPYRINRCILIPDLHRFPDRPISLAAQLLDVIKPFFPVELNHGRSNHPADVHYLGDELIDKNCDQGCIHR